MQKKNKMSTILKVTEVIIIHINTDHFVLTTGTFLPKLNVHNCSPRTTDY